MSGLKEKLGIKVFVILLFSIFILAGLTVTQAYGQPLDSPLYNHTNTKAVESMNAPTDANLVAGGTTVLQCFTAGQATCSNCLTTEPITCAPQWTCTPTCRWKQSLPVMSTAGEIVFILTLTGGACWAILRKKSS